MTREDIIKKQLKKKVDELAKIESKLVKSFANYDLNTYVSSELYACFDGFIILRTFNKIQSASKIYFNTSRLVNFINNSLPISSDIGNLNLYKILKNSIGLELRPGLKMDFASQGRGVNVGRQFTIPGFQIIIDTYDNIEQIKNTIEDIKFTVYSATQISQLEADNNELQKKIKLLESFKEPKIITEGKTDWKYFIAALNYFHSKKEYLNIQEKLFLKFGSKDDLDNNICNTNFELDNSVSTLNKILDSIIESRKILNSEASNFSMIIGIFDSDENQAKERKNHKEKVYSFLLKQKNISTELLFSETEIKTLILGRRLYLGNEFDETTGQLKDDRTITLGNNNNIIWRS